MYTEATILAKMAKKNRSQCSHCFPLPFPSINVVQKSYSTAMDGQWRVIYSDTTMLRREGATLKNGFY